MNILQSIFSDYYKHIIYEMENALLYMQITQQEKRIREEEKNYREVQLLRHDLKRYLVTYRQLLQEGKYEVIEADIDKILGKRLNTNHCVYTENTILNAVICEKELKPDELDLSNQKNRFIMEIGRASCRDRVSSSV